MNLDQRPVTQPCFHGVPPSGLDGASTGLHPVFQYGFSEVAYPLKSLMALPLLLGASDQLPDARNLLTATE
jgi:hypothetical protein